MGDDPRVEAKAKANAVKTDRANDAMGDDPRVEAKAKANARAKNGKKTRGKTTATAATTTPKKKEANGTTTTTTTTTGMVKKARTPRAERGAPRAAAPAAKSATPTRAPAVGPPMTITRGESVQKWSNSTTRAALRVEASIRDWIRADGGRELARELQEALSCGDGHVTMQVCEESGSGALFVGLHCGEAKFAHALQRVHALVEVKLDDCVRIRRRTGVADMLENERMKIQAEIDAGLRCEFTLGYKAMQDLLLDGGDKLNQVKEVCDVERVVVDPRKRTIRIVGADAAEVSRARDMLEVAYESIEDVPELALRMIIGKGGAKVNDIQQRTGANIKVDWDKSAVFIRGPPSAVKSAMILVKSCIKTYEVEHVEVTYDQLDEVRGELARLDMEWGGSPVHYVQGGRGGGRGRRNDRSSTAA